MNDSPNIVPVLKAHLVEWEQTLAITEGLLVAQDLTQEYKNMGTMTRPSRLTTNVQRQLERVRGYLVEPEDDRIPGE